MLELVHFSGAHVTTDLAGRLNAAGLRARAVVSYDQLEQRLNADARGLPECAGECCLAGLLAAQARRCWHSNGASCPRSKRGCILIAISAAAAQRLDGVVCCQHVYCPNPGSGRDAGRTRTGAGHA